MRTPTSRRGGFTLIEILVVLTLASVVVAISIRGFNEMSAGNKRTSCQTNLQQLYGGLRLYMADEAGNPPPYAVDASGVQTGGIGMWALYTFQNPNDPSGKAIAPVGQRPIERYLKSTKSLHCPADVEHENLYTDASKTQFNPDFLSYQGTDNNATPKDISDDFQKYLPERGAVAGRRQLQSGSGTLPADDTVVTWCPYHRADRDSDEVLFFDGTVQYLPRQQAVQLDSATNRNIATGGSCTTLSATCVTGAARVLKSQ